MDLRDTLQTKLGELKEKAQSIVGTFLKKTEDPLADIEARKYFEVLCGMGFSVPMGSDGAQKMERSKKYIEYFLGGVCNEEKLQKAIEAYERSMKVGSSEVETELREERYRFEKTESYRLDKFKASRMFCQDEIATATEGISNILEVIKDNLNYRHFSQGLYKLKCSDTIKNIVIGDSFCNGDPITRELVIKHLLDTFVSRITDDSYNRLRGYAHDMALVVLKALNFEYYGTEREGYPPINDNEYINLVNSVAAYKNTIENHPFDKERYTEKFVNSIKNAKVFAGWAYGPSPDSFTFDKIEDYFCDAVCHALWKKIAAEGNWARNGKDISNSQDYADMFDMVYTYLKNLSEE